MAMDALGGARDSAFGLLGRIAGFPDSFEKEWQRKALYIIFDLGLIALIVAGSIMMSGGVHSFATKLLDPNFTTIMTLSMATVGLGVGLSMLVEDILPSKACRGAGKVLALAMPILLLGGALALMAAGGKTTIPTAHTFHFSFSKAMTSRYFYIGLLLLPLVPYTAKKGVSRFIEEQVPWIGPDLPQRARASRHRPLSRPPSLELSSLSEDSAEEGRRIHDSYHSSDDWLSDSEEEDSWSIDPLSRPPGPEISPLSEDSAEEVSDSYNFSDDWSDSEEEP